MLYEKLGELLAPTKVCTVYLSQLKEFVSVLNAGNSCRPAMRERFEKVADPLVRALCETTLGLVKEKSADSYLTVEKRAGREGIVGGNYLSCLFCICCWISVC